VQKGRERLQVVIEPEPDDEAEHDEEPMDELAPVDAEPELQDTFFDQDAR
jgi:hypothetical protein